MSDLTGEFIQCSNWWSSDASCLGRGLSSTLATCGSDSWCRFKSSSLSFTNSFACTDAYSYTHAHVSEHYSQSFHTRATPHQPLSSLRRTHAQSPLPPSPPPMHRQCRGHAVQQGHAYGRLSFPPCAPSHDAFAPHARRQHSSPSARSAPRLARHALVERCLPSGLCPAPELFQHASTPQRPWVPIQAVSRGHGVGGRHG